MNNPTLPNILLIMADQLAAPALAVYGPSVVKSPHLDKLARESVVFDCAYCNYPLCVPSRASLHAGSLPSRIGSFDNGAEFPATIPTFLHYLRAAGYKTCLSGKMHFVGPDQLHGYEDRLTTDIYPSDFTWSADWSSGQVNDEYSHRISVINDSGICARSLQLDYDEETLHQAEQKIYDYARESDGRPFFFTVSLTHPHNPYVITKEYWDRYDGIEINMPSVPRLRLEDLDPHSRRLFMQMGLDREPPSDETIRRTRRAYYGMISYVDDQVARLLRALERASLAESTVVIFTGDHGDMMGERGLFYKLNFYEWSARVPLIVRMPNGPRGVRCAQNVSLMDMFPTFLDMGRVPASERIGSTEGRSLMGILSGREEQLAGSVYGEYMAEGTFSPCLMIRKGRFKLVYCEDDPVMLYDLASDPLELRNLGRSADHRELVAEFMDELHGVWNPQQLKKAILDNQRQRKLVYKGLKSGRYNPWDYQPFIDMSHRYIRSGQSVSTTEPRSRLTFS